MGGGAWKGLAGLLLLAAVVFIGSLLIPRATCSVVLKVQCAEQGTTGMREAMVVARVGIDGAFPPSPFAPDVDLDSVARRTPGFSGADLANVINEAALLTARQDQKLITMNTLEESIDRVM